MNDETREKMEELWQACEEWISENQPTCAESFYQVDNVNLALPELGIKICEIVGYSDPYVE